LASLELHLPSRLCKALKRLAAQRKGKPEDVLVDVFKIISALYKAQLKGKGETKYWKLAVYDPSIRETEAIGNRVLWRRFRDSRDQVTSENYSLAQPRQTELEKIAAFYETDVNSLLLEGLHKLDRAIRIINKETFKELAIEYSHPLVLTEHDMVDTKIDEVLEPYFSKN
jgi:hypothetical protein